MSDESEKYFFAGCRGYYTDGDTFLAIIGLGSFNNQSFEVSERKLNESGIKLGDFLSAFVPMGKPVTNFKKLNYKFKVKVDGNFASVEDLEADLEKDKDGNLVFKTKTFGSVGSVSKIISPGKYKISIKATKNHDAYLYNNLKYCGEVKEVVVPSSSPSDLVVGTGFAQSTSSSYTPPSVIVKAGFQAAPSKKNKKKMNAFVHSVKQKGDDITHFLWICDNQQNSIFTSKNLKLGIGHFFEGIFEETPTKISKWECVKYIDSIEDLMKGSLIGNRIQLIATVDRYDPENSHAHSKYLGVIIDNYKKLSTDCVGRQVQTQLLKVDGVYRWAVIELL